METLTQEIWRKLRGKPRPPEADELPPPKATKPAAAAPAQPPGKKTAFEVAKDPQSVLERRMKEQGLKCGGKVKKMASGGAVRGGGCVVKGVGRGTMR